MDPIFFPGDPNTDPNTDPNPWQLYSTLMNLRLDTI
jgi:hypothetical protein